MVSLWLKKLCYLAYSEVVKNALSLGYITKSTNHAVWIVSATVSRKEEVLEEGNYNELRRRQEVPTQADRASEVYSFDALAMGLADGTITRSRALKLMGAAVLGGFGAMVGISAAAGNADAKRGGKHKRRQHTKHATSMCLFTCTSGCCVGNDCKAGNTTQFCGTGPNVACTTCKTGDSCLVDQSGKRQCCPPSRVCGSICCSDTQTCQMGTCRP
jgi:hypothetical protein